jgi:hypothetical protein
MTDRIERQWFTKGTGDKPIDLADAFFISELEFQSDFGLRAFGEMQQAYTKSKENPSLIALAHILLVFANNVGKILRPSKTASPEAIARAQRLSKMLGLEDADFEQIRLARNYFEHFDERIERYIGSHEGLLIHRKVLDHHPETVELDDGRKFTPFFLQLLNTTTLELTLYDQKFDIREIVKQLQLIHTKAKEWHESRVPPAG